MCVAVNESHKNPLTKMTHARDPKQMLLKTQEKKDEEAEEAETATDRHRQA